MLASEFPSVPVVGEEFGADAGAAEAPLRWVVDPVDGTANYVAGFPWCAYSLALVDASGPVVGVIADPSRAQIYAAARGPRGARQRRAGAGDTPLARSAGSSARNCRSTAAPRSPGARRPPTPACGRWGRSALAITQVALGHAVAAVLDGYREWDVAGALCLAAEAGALVVDGEGRPDPLPRGVMLVAVPGALEDVLGWWRAG